MGSLIFLKNVIFFPIRFIEYIAIVLFSLSHELGHAQCIIEKAKSNQFYNYNEYVVIAFGDYEHGKLLFSTFYPKNKKDIRICFFSISSEKNNPITLSSYYAKFNRAEIIACAKAGYEAELHCLHKSILIFICLLIVFALTRCLLIGIIMLFYLFKIITRGLSCKLTWCLKISKKKNQEVIANDYYHAHHPKSFKKKCKAYAYNKLIRKYL